MVCCSHQSDHRIRLCILHQSDCCIRVCISQQWCHRIWISCTSHSIWGFFFFFQWCHGIRGLCTKNDINQKFWAHLISFMIVAFARASSSKVKIYCNMKGLHLILLLFNIFSCSFSHNTHAKQLTFHHVLWKQCPKSNQNIPNHCTTWTLGNFSSAWMVLHQSNSI